VITVFQIIWGSEVFQHPKTPANYGLVTCVQTHEATVQNHTVSLSQRHIQKSCDRTEHCCYVMCVTATEQVST